MLLQTILFGSFTPPEATSKRTHRIGFGYLPRYTKPKPVQRTHYTKVEGYVVQSEADIIKAMKKLPPHVTTHEISVITRYTRNHCGIILNKMFKKGLVTRVQIKANGTRLYKYTLKEQG